MESSVKLAYIAYEVRVSCKGPLSAAVYVFVTSKTNFMYFKQHRWLITHSDGSIAYVTALVSLTESVFM